MLSEAPGNAQSLGILVYNSQTIYWGIVGKKPLKYREWRVVWEICYRS